LLTTRISTGILVNELLLAQLKACPVCRGELSGRADECPGCGAQLAPYYEQIDEANRSLTEAFNAMTRGEIERARELGGEAQAMTPLVTENVALLQARIALSEKRFADAWEQVQGLPDTVKEKPGLLHEIVSLHEVETTGKQHFNLALTSARRKYYVDASYHIERAIELIPYLAPIWRLAVKIELKRGRYDIAQQYLEEGLLRFPNETYLASLERNRNAP
jgi:tetratricopeptide (TPR) repeat protein